MKRQTLKISIIILVLTFVLTGCSKDNNDASDLTPTSVSESIVTPMATATVQPTATTQVAPEATSEPTPEVNPEPTSTPEPTPTLEVLLDLTKEQEQEVWEIAETYRYIVEEEGPTNTHGRLIIAYYMYIGKLDKELAVVVVMSSKEASDMFGGEWIGLEPNEGMKNQNYAYGMLTVAEIDKIFLDSNVNLFVAAVEGVDYSGLVYDVPLDAPFVWTLTLWFSEGDIRVYKWDNRWVIGTLASPA